MVAKFQKKVLKNGITLLHEYRDVPVVALSISNPFGASHESSKIKGIAHFIEHLLFTGTEKRTHEDISREIEKKGGVLNAFTAQDVTSYWFKLPAEHVFAGLDILTDMLNNASFNEEKFEKEKKVILEEIKMYHDVPQYAVFENALANLYEKPFGEGIIGSAETISPLNRNFVKSLFSEKYSPENLIVTVVGKADFQKLCVYLEKTFDKKRKINLEKNIKLKKINRESSETRDGIDQSHFVFAIHCPLATDDKKYAFEVLDAHLANGMSSKLFLEIREKRGLAYAVKSSIHTEKNYSYYTIYVGTKKEAIPEVKKLILEGFKNIEKMTEFDLEEAKTRLIGLKEISSEESAHVMNDLMMEHLSTGSTDDFYKYKDEIRKVKLSEVKAMAKIKSFSTAAIVPK